MSEVFNLIKMLGHVKGFIFLLFGSLFIIFILRTATNYLDALRLFDLFFIQPDGHRNKGKDITKAYLAYVFHCKGVDLYSKLKLIHNTR